MYNKIIRSRRKTIGLEVRENAEVVLRLPWGAKQNDIDRFLQKNAGWIERAKKKVLEREKCVSGIEFRVGSYVPYLGMSYPLGTLIGSVSEEKGKEGFILWAKEEAKRIFASYAEIHAKKAGKAYSGIRITNAKKRWGSCSSKDTLSFAWRLILGPLWVLDYVMAHEVAHLIHRNHGKRFWKKVEILYPDYKKARKWLKHHGHLLTIK
ncbi:MAG: SprT family zinc-dependent metalloprotease [Nanoarchaeota archaeon]|nr:SprT family zinc-dependent metalloprotease [Nanoarchaeota archaeon]